jgi:hypothetical protein
LNAVDKATFELLTGLVLEFNRAPNTLPKLHDIKALYYLKSSEALLESAIGDFEQKGWILVSRTHADGINVSIKRAKYGSVLAYLLEIIDGTIFEVNWKKEEILTDAPAGLDIPCPDGWKILYVESDKTEKTPQPLTATTPSIHIINQFSPSNVHSTPSATPNPFARSSARAGWTNAALGVIGIVATAVSVIVALWIAGKI